MNTWVNAGGIAYGAALVFAAFVRNGLTEALRVDALFIRDAGENTRPLNLVFGALIAGYGIYSLLA